MAAGDRLEQQQDWLLTRFRHIVPEDFEQRARFCSIPGLDPPPGFEAAWSAFRQNPGEDPDVAHVLGFPPYPGPQADFVIIFADPMREEEMSRLRTLVTSLDSLGAQAPPMIWAPHGVAPALRAPEEESSHSALISEMMNLGLDSALCGESEGLKMIFEVRARLQLHRYASETLVELITQRRERSEEKARITESIDKTFWEYLRARLVPQMPPVDPQLEAGKEIRCPGYTLDRVLGKGVFGCVYQITDTNTGQVQALKAVAKEGIKYLSDLRCMQRMIEAMSLLSTTWKHPNVTQFYQVYHAKNYILYRIEYAGPENLYKRLSHRQKDGAQYRPLNLEKVKSILRQCYTSVHFLHTGPKLCHRDIKPENFIVDETDDSIMVKLTDFDLSVHMERGLCSSPCGTLPFTAPEVLLNRHKYVGSAADVWSLGIVTLEIVCRVRVVEDVLGLSVKCSGSGESEVAVASTIKEGFVNEGDAGRMTRGNCRDELRPLLAPVCCMLDGMLNTAAGDRWTAEMFPPALDKINAVEAAGETAGVNGVEEDVEIVEATDIDLEI